jgi:opacity protein-like surface antigen
MGTAFFPFPPEDIGPLAILAEGKMNRVSAGFGGVQIGYEWPWYSQCSNWSFASALELEAYFFGQKQEGHLINSSSLAFEHDFADSFRMNMDTLLVNAVFSFNNSCWCRFSPYIGGGIGATRISIRDADSEQVEPVEAMNHFNSKQDDQCWAFTAQVKAGLRYNICRSLHIFGEYRYVFVDFSNYIFGSTVDPDHVATSPWNVKINDFQYNAFAIGLRYDL